MDKKKKKILLYTVAGLGLAAGALGIYLLSRKKMMASMPPAQTAAQLIETLKTFEMSGDQQARRIDSLTKKS